MAKATSKKGSLFIQPEGPNTEMFYLGCHTMGDLTDSASGAVTPFYCWDPSGNGWEEAGELIAALNSGAISLDHIHAELGEIVIGKRPGRQNPRQITIFKSVGLAIQDAAAAAIVLRNADASGLGSLVTFVD